MHNNIFMKPSIKINELRKIVKEEIIKLYLDSNPPNPQRINEFVNKIEKVPIRIIEDENEMIIAATKSGVQISRGILKNLNPYPKNEEDAIIMGEVIAAFVGSIDLQNCSRSEDYTAFRIIKKYPSSNECLVSYEDETNPNLYPYAQIILPPNFYTPTHNLVPAPCETIYLSQRIGENLEHNIGHAILAKFVKAKYLSKVMKEDEKKILKKYYVSAMRSIGETLIPFIFLAALQEFYKDKSPEKIMEIIGMGRLEELENGFAKSLNEIIDVVIKLVAINDPYLPLPQLIALKYLSEYGIKNFNLPQLIESKPEERIKDKAFVGKELSWLSSFILLNSWYKLARHFDSLISGRCPSWYKIVKGFVQISQENEKNRFTIYI